MTERTDAGGRPGPGLDHVGRLIERGRETTEYLWRVPDDPVARGKVAALLLEIRSDQAARATREIPALCDALGPAVNAAPTPHSVEILQDGFERLHRLWLTTRSGLV